MFLLCLFVSQARANYWYKLKLEGGDWTNWIYSEQGANGVKWSNCLERLITDGETVKDVANNDVSVADKTKIVGFALKGRTEDNFNVLQSNDYAAFTSFRQYVKEFDLSEWGLTSWTGNLYFAWMENLETLNLPNNTFAFEEGDGLQDGYMFAHCTKLNNIVWGENTRITKIGKGTFEECNALPQNMVERLLSETSYVGDRAFVAAKAVETLTIPSNVNHIGAEAFCEIGATTVNFSTAASQALEIGNRAFQNSTSLTNVNFSSGNINIANRAFAGCSRLKDVNLNEIVMTNLEYAAFADCRDISSQSVNAILARYAQYKGSGAEVPDHLFFGCNGLDGTKNFTWLDLPAEYTTIGAGAFGSAGDNGEVLHNIIVHNATAPVCETDNNPEFHDGHNDLAFAGVEPNHVTIYFKDAAATVSDGQGAFYSYMEEGSEWQRLLTKTLLSTNTTYDVYPQQHAIVKLTRPLKAGWNTLCLPFAANYAIKQLGGRKQNTEILKDALNAKSGSSFKLAVYRGYYKNNDLFRFLNYARFDTDPIDAFEAFMVHMDESDLADNDVYTFTNVDLNYRYALAPGATAVNSAYDLDNPEIYNGTDPSTGAKRGAVPLKEFNGRENTDVKPFNDGNSNYDDYVFRGSYVQIVESVSDNPTPVSQSLTSTSISVLKESNNSGETSANLIDGKTSTKYCADKGSDGDAVAWIVYHLPAAKAVNAYSITSANDYHERDPKNWKLQGSNDGNTWTDLDTQSGQTFNDRYETKKYMVYGGASYEYYRLYITDTYDTNNTMIQLSEWTLEDTNLSVKDAFIQNTDNGTYFYHCKANKKYGVRGFCGWFKYVGSESVAAAPKAMIPAAFYDGEFDEEPTEIVFFDSNGNEQPAYYDVYTLGGQQVRSHAASLAGLPKGLYIVNGKKVVVK